MTLMQQGRHYGRTGNLSNWIPDSDRVMRAVRERPEALLVIAAGVALLFRGGGRGMRRNMDRNMDRGWITGRGSRGLTTGDVAESAAETVREGAETFTRVASNIAGDFVDTASEYTSAATRWAEDAGETLAVQARSLPGELDEAVRDHPLVLAALGVALGAAVGASLPASRLENRTFGTARDQLGDAAEGVTGRFTEAAEEALDAAKRGAERLGVSGDSMRDVAHEAAGAFASVALGSEKPSSAQRQNPQGAGSSGSGFSGRRNT